MSHTVNTSCEMVIYSKTFYSGAAKTIEQNPSKQKHDFHDMITGKTDAVKYIRSGAVTTPSDYANKLCL